MTMSPCRVGVPAQQSSPGKAPAPQVREQEELATKKRKEHKNKDAGRCRVGLLAHQFLLAKRRWWASTPTLPWSLLALLFAFAAGCTSNSGGLPTIDVPIGSRTFQLEVAKTPPDREKGLMERDSMPADHGMLFVFDKEEPLNFWMKNTRFSLDIIYLDHNDKVVSIHQMQKYDLTDVSSDFPAQFAIELNLGATNAAGIHVGDVVAIPKSATAP